MCRRSSTAGSPAARHSSTSPCGTRWRRCATPSAGRSSSPAWRTTRRARSPRRTSSPRSPSGESAMPDRQRADAAGPRDRWALVTAGTVYVLAWVIGLLVAPAAPDAFAPDAVIHAHFAQHGGAALGQALLVHGVAGVALAGFVLAVARRLRTRPAQPSW